MTRQTGKAHQQGSQVTMSISEKNRGWLAQLLLAQRAQHSCLPACLGLDVKEFAAVFPDANPVIQEDLRQELLQLRVDEWNELRELLLRNRAGVCAGERLMASVVAAGCLGGDHLWRDLGLDSRAELRELLQDNFPAMVAANSGDMKWKKFFYKQLCEAEGGYVCRSPTCESCVAYDDCFGPEE